MAQVDLQIKCDLAVMASNKIRCDFSVGVATLHKVLVDFLAPKPSHLLKDALSKLPMVRVI